MKKLLSALLVLVMLLSLPGIGALAASDGLTWSLDKKGTLTISGKGEMPDYSGDTPPWEKYRDDIKAVVIEKGVTHIGAQCFQFCTKLKSVTIPSSVESIGDAAFYRCEKLSAVTLPDALTEIADQTFDHCTALKSIVIPDSVTRIGESAFNGCQKLETVYYGGTASDWDEIEIARYNKRLTSAEHVFSDAETPAPASSGKPSAGSKLK